MTFRTLIAVVAIAFVPSLVLAEVGPLERVQTIGYELAEIEDLAGRLERHARTVRRAAERVVDPVRDQEVQTLEYLIALEERAGSFHDDVGRFGRGFSSAEGDFGEVQRAYIRVSQAIGDLVSWSKVRPDFDRLSDAMFELEMYTVDLLTRIHIADERAGERLALTRQSETRGGQERRRAEIVQAFRLDAPDWVSRDCLNVALR